LEYYIECRTQPATRDESWYYNFETFKKLFLGETKAGKSCEILNDSSLIIIYDQKDKILTVKSRDPVIILNKNLGYRTEYLLEYFQFDMKQNHVTFAGYPFYKELEGSKGKQKNGVKIG